MAKERNKESQGRDIERVVPGHVLSPFEEMDRLFESFAPRGWMRPFRWDWPAWGDVAAPFEGKTPRVDVVDREAEILVRAELPGVDKKDLDISLTDNTVTIKASSAREEKEEKGNYYRCEISRGAFARTVALPSDVDTDSAKASFKDGVLELTLPKVERSRRRKIKVE
ncbi:MAG: Hsp20/alpha crystallin family protein [Pseudomonadota bacterium]|nr:MAG: Hsp20/alpha crystallin family protein [Pseudomonadota bacterium]